MVQWYRVRLRAVGLGLVHISYPFSVLELSRQKEVTIILFIKTRVRRCLKQLEEGKGSTLYEMKYSNKRNSLAK